MKQIQKQEIDFYEGNDIKKEKRNLKQLLKEKSSFKNVIYLGKRLQEITIAVSETDGRHNVQLLTAKDINENIRNDRWKSSIY